VAEVRKRLQESPRLSALPIGQTPMQTSLPGAKDHHLNWASMEPPRPSIGGKEVGPVNMDLHDLSTAQIPHQA
jgi:hypothetical protein